MHGSSIKEKYFVGKDSLKNQKHNKNPFNNYLWMFNMSDFSL